MTESYEQGRERVRFDVLPDGTVEGDDRAAGNLAAALRYACRMGSQIGELLDLGGLERLSTMSTLAVVARASGVAPDLSIMAEVEVHPTPLPEIVPVPGLSPQEAIRQGLRRATIDFSSDWAALMTDEGKLVGSMHDELAGTVSADVVAEVGLRVLAVLGALDETLRETAVRLDFVRGSVLVVAIGAHALFTHADKFAPHDVVRTVGAVQSMLDGVELAREAPITSSLRV